ncbi:transposase family protein [Streptomyces sp. NPDC056638]|uniref:transposase family protein n=1 Tax=Streptomyces sp. NPDC056638 TaxID=3345887 RepID=UPI0036774AE2
MPADASSPITCAFDQLREHLEVVSEEVPSLLERLAEVPDPRDPRGVRHRLTVVLALTACAVLAGARNFLWGSRHFEVRNPPIGERRDQ